MVETLGNIIIEAIKKDIRPNAGLLDGMMGISLSFFVMSEFTHNHSHSFFAEKILQNITSNPMIDNNLSFGSGIEGIGWAISFLERRGHIEGDIDKILFNYDATIYRSVTNPKSRFSFNTANGLVGVLLYLTERLICSNTSKDIQQHYLLRELLCLVLEKIDIMVPRTFSRISKDLYITALWEYPILFRCLSTLLAENIEKNKIEKLCGKWFMFLQGTMPFYHINRLALAISLIKVGRELNNDKWEKLALKMIEDLSFDNIMQEINERIHNINEGWFYIAYLLYEAGQMLQIIESRYLQIEMIRNQLVGYFMPKFKAYLDKHRNEGVFKTGLINGLSGVCLLYVLCPGCLKYSISL